MFGRYVKFVLKASPFIMVAGFGQQQTYGDFSKRVYDKNSVDYNGIITGYTNIFTMFPPNGSFCTTRNDRMEIRRNS
jgi:hypothetical protein